MTGGILGKKIEMTRKIVAEDGVIVPVTAVQVLENEILQVKTAEKDGKNAIVLGMDPYTRATKNIKYKTVKEFEVSDPSLYTKGQKLTLDILKDIKEVNLSSWSKGKGFQGVMRRHNFGGGPASHGSHFHREPGSIGQRALPGKVQKGKKLPGHMGFRKVTIKNRPLIGMDAASQVIWVKGAIPGARNTVVYLSY